MKRIRAVVFLVLSLVFFYLAVVGISTYLKSQATTSVQAEEASATITVVVASSEIPLATAITPEMLTTMRVASKSQPKGSFSSVEELEGRIAVRNVLEGEIILEGILAGSDSASGLAATIPLGMRAVTVSVNEVIGVAGFLNPGDFVDVVATLNPDEFQSKLVSKVVLQNIRVLAVGEESASRESKEARRVDVVTLLVTPEQSEKLALAAAHGEILLAMRNLVDLEEETTTGVSSKDLIPRTGKSARRSGGARSGDRVEVILGGKVSHRSF